MRRTALFFAGAVMATGAAMAVAGPASAAAGHSTAKSCSSFGCSQSPWSPFTSNNPQFADQRAYTDQNALSNVGNPQFGLVNLNALNGGASNTSSTGLLAGLLG